MFQRVFARVTTLALVHLLAAYILLPVLGPYMRSLGHNDAFIALVFSLFSIGVILTGIWVGSLTERFGRVRVVRVAILTNIIAFSLYMVGASWAIVLGRFLDGACFATITIITLSLAEDSVDDNERGSKTGLLLSLESGARLLGPLIGGVLADHFIGLPFFTTIGLFVALLLLNKAVLKGFDDGDGKARKVHSMRARFTSFVTNKHLHPIAILGFAISASVPIIMLFIPLFITGELGLSYAQAGLAVSMYGAAHLLQFLFGHFADTFGRKRLLSLGGMIYGLALIGLAMQGTSYGQLLIFIALCGIGNSIWSVSATSYLAAIASEYGGREEMIGVYLSVTKVGEVISFLVIGLLAVAASERTVFSVVGTIVILASLLSSALFITIFKGARKNAAVVYQKSPRRF